MQVKIKPGNISGVISVPPSKSITHRAIIIASLAKGKSVIKNRLKSVDTDLTVKACKELGVEIDEMDNQLIINGVNGKFILFGKTKNLFVGESGTTLRLLTTLSVLTDGIVIIDGERKLRERPIGDLIDVLQKQGIDARSINNDDCPPVEIKGSAFKGGEITVESEKSSQFASAIMLISPYAQNDVILKPIKIKSAPYLNITWLLIREFGAQGEFDSQVYKIKAGNGFQAREYTVEGDWTSASYFIVAAAVTGSTVTISNLNQESMQGDRTILSFLSKMGCKIEIKSSGIEVTGSILNSIEENLGDNPDIVPSLCIAAAFASGKSKFTNIGHLIYKESNRLDSICLELNKMGIDAYYDSSQIVISGGKPRGTIIDSHNDHRIAMSFSIAALAAEGETTINDAEVVSKSYPGFFADLNKLGAKIL